ncbi:hypothetical protein [Clostridium botulinum]|uniref:hypothetical protein n=1 Tax=Clostridium botulinum TaxID=1491 RepID=UPI0013F71A78|nr:hypothetical protein [Clostridium botulinum]MBY6842899.1 hypothetical protein [Clostridium botulinum]MBY6844635.1 hypothetical protein [Clostridium botulinum]MCJ8173954.1 hypothetical protein [Clostridium botulinum]NFJ83993.1 hypothetical protein [Clostridium botulinum]NFK78978.1 hypothetical protein [Clostridium botulinum]
MTKELVFNLISKDKENLIKIGKAVRVDFEGVLGYYIVFDKMPINKALLKVSDDIVKEYKNKMEVWIAIQEELNY